MIYRGDEIPERKQPTVRIDWEAQTIDIYGGESSYTEHDPYHFRFDRVGSVRDVAEWMAHVTQKTWCTESCAHKLADSLVVVYEYNIGKRR